MVIDIFLGGWVICAYPAKNAVGFGKFDKSFPEKKLKKIKKKLISGKMCFTFCKIQNIFREANED